MAYSADSMMVLQPAGDVFFIRLCRLAADFPVASLYFSPKLLNFTVPFVALPNFFSAFLNSFEFFTRYPSMPCSVSLSGRYFSSSSMRGFSGFAFAFGGGGCLRGCLFPELHHQFLWNTRDGRGFWRRASRFRRFRCV